VRGIKLAKADQVISMAILAHIEASPAERAAYIRQANTIRRGGAEPEQDMEAENNGEEAVVLTPERYAELSAHEEFVLTVSENGYGKRTSAYEYRISGRGGKGIIAMVVNERNGKLIASFPVEDSDQIMLVTDGGQLIRVPVEDISIMGRSTQGVIVFSTSEGERVVSVEHIPDENGGAEIVAEEGNDFPPE
jgi:DNA gyrase subunit A